MPTMVERGFLKLDGWDSPEAQLRLDQSFLKIDGVIAGLEGAGSTAAFLKLEHSPLVQHTFDTLGNGFFKLGGDFGVIANAGLGLGEFVVKLSPVIGTGDFTGGDKIRSDFLKVEQTLSEAGYELKLTGKDVDKLGQAGDVIDFLGKVDIVKQDFVDLGVALGDGSVFKHLGEDFLRLGGDGGGALKGEYLKLGKVFEMIGGDVDKIHADLGGLENAWPGSTTDLKIGGDVTGGGSIGTALGALNQDIVSLGADFSAIGSPLGALIGLLRNNFGGGGGSGFGGGGGSG